MIKVLHIDTGLTFRGGQHQINLLVQNLKRFDIDQFLACPDESPLVEKTSGIISEHFPLPNSNLMRFIKKGRLKRFIRNKRIDIIHAHDSHSHSLMVLLEQGTDLPRFVVTRRSSAEVKFGSKTKYLAHNIHYIAISNHIYNKLIFSGVPGKSISTIPSMLELERFKKNHQPAAEENYENKEKLIVSSGALDKKKGFFDSIRAIHQLGNIRKDFCYKIYGEGPQRRRLLRYLNKHNLNDLVKLPGWHDDPSIFIKDADIFLAPSYTEGLGMAVVEAMALGVPIVATDIPAVREIIEDGQTGLLFPVSDIDEMTRRLNLLMDNPDLEEKLRENAKEAISRFDCMTVSGEIFRLYNEILTSTPQNEVMKWHQF